MKHTSSLLLLAAFAPALILSSGCSKSETDSAAAKSKAAAKDIAADVKEVAQDSWTAIRDCTYENRGDFVAGMDRMAQACDTEYAVVKTNLASMRPAATELRDQAMADFATARAALSSQLIEARSGSAENWDAAKDKTAQAWKAVQDAFARVKAFAVS